MKKIVDDFRLIVKCCTLYYEELLSQQEIAKHLNISRTSVSRMLKEGYERGVVRIEINKSNNFAKIENELEKKFGLKEMVIVNTNSNLSNNNINDQLAEEAVKFLTRILDTGEYVGVSMGTTLYKMTLVNIDVDKNKKCKFIPMMGGISEKNYDIHSNSIAMRMAKLFGGEYFQFWAPALFSDINVLKGFMKEKSIQNILKLLPKITTAIVSIGTTDVFNSTIVRTGDIDIELLDEAIKKGAVGDVAFHLYDLKGESDKFFNINNRVAGISMDGFKKIPKRIGVAGGKTKIQSILGALNGKFINILITDDECAKGLLSYKI